MHNFLIQTSNRVKNIFLELQKEEIDAFKFSFQNSQYTIHYDSLNIQPTQNNYEKKKKKIPSLFSTLSSISTTQESGLQPIT